MSQLINLVQVSEMCAELSKLPVFWPKIYRRVRKCAVVHQSTCLSSGCTLFIVLKREVECLRVSSGTWNNAPLLSTGRRPVWSHYEALLGMYWDVM